MDLKDKCYAVRSILNLTQKEFGMMIASNQTEVSFIERGFIPKQKQIYLIELLYERVEGNYETNKD